MHGNGGTAVNASNRKSHEQKDAQQLTDPRCPGNLLSSMAKKRSSLRGEGKHGTTPRMCITRAANCSGWRRGTEHHRRGRTECDDPITPRNMAMEKFSPQVCSTLMAFTPTEPLDNVIAARERCETSPCSVGSWHSKPKSSVANLRHTTFDTRKSQQQSEKSDHTRAKLSVASSCGPRYARSWAWQVPPTERLECSRIRHWVTWMGTVAQPHDTMATALGACPTRVMARSSTGS